MNYKSLYIVAYFILSGMILFACNRKNTNSSPSDNTEIPTSERSSQKTTSQSDDDTSNQVKVEIRQELKDLESEFTEMLAPISSLKQEKPETYWFIVSWLKTNYGSPDWTNYETENWRLEAKKKGIDCSGFARIMLDKIYNKKVFGGSQGILDKYSTRINIKDINMGDLVFFRNLYAANDNIVHVGIYLMDNYFVHATSTDSAAKGNGLMINSLEEENWKKELVTAGRIKG